MLIMRRTRYIEHLQVYLGTCNSVPLSAHTPFPPFAGNYHHFFEGISENTTLNRPFSVCGQGRSIAAISCHLMGRIAEAKA